MISWSRLNWCALSWTRLSCMFNCGRESVELLPWFRLNMETLSQRHVMHPSFNPHKAVRNAAISAPMTGLNLTTAAKTIFVHPSATLAITARHYCNWKQPNIPQALLHWHPPLGRRTSLETGLGKANENNGPHLTLHG
jgi:hypothetical protein